MYTCLYIFKEREYVLVSSSDFRPKMICHCARPVFNYRKQFVRGPRQSRAPPRTDQTTSVRRSLLFRHRNPVNGTHGKTWGGRLVPVTRYVDFCSREHDTDIESSPCVLSNNSLILLDEESEENELQFSYLTSKLETD